MIADHANNEMWEINHAMLRKDLADFLSAHELDDLAQKARCGEYDIGGLWPEARIVVDFTRRWQARLGRQSTAGEMAGRD
jgi:hypothetical protein